MFVALQINICMLLTELVSVNLLNLFQKLVTGIYTLKLFIEKGNMKSNVTKHTREKEQLVNVLRDKLEVHNDTIIDEIPSENFLYLKALIRTKMMCQHKSKDVLQTVVWLDVEIKAKKKLLKHIEIG